MKPISFVLIVAVALLLLPSSGNAATLEKATLGCLHQATLYRSLQLSKNNKLTALKGLVDRAIAARECAFLKKGQNVKTIVDSPKSGLACVETQHSPKCLYVVRTLILP